MPEERGLYPRMVLEEQLVFMAAIKGMGRKEAEKRLGPWLERLGLADWRKKKTNELSKGMQQKAQFIATVLHEPDVLFMDEPMSGLDPVGMDVMREVMLDLRRKGTTIVLSSHQMEAVERLCDRVALINRGEKVLDGSVAEVKARHGKNTVVLAYDGDGSFLASLPGVAKVTDFGQYVEVRLQDGRRPAAAAAGGGGAAPPAPVRDRGAEPARHLRRDREGPREGGRVSAKLWAVVKREYLERVRTKGFVIGTILGPLLMGGMMIVPALAARSGSKPLRVAVLDGTGALQAGGRGGAARRALRRQGALRRAARPGRTRGRPRRRGHGRGRRGRAQEGRPRGPARRLPPPARGRGGGRDGELLRPQRQQPHRPADDGADGERRARRPAAHRGRARPREGEGPHEGAGPQDDPPQREGRAGGPGRGDDLLDHPAHDPLHEHPACGGRR